MPPLRGIFCFMRHSTLRMNSERECAQALTIPQNVRTGPGEEGPSMQQIIDFILELDKLKAVTRKVRPLGSATATKTPPSTVGRLH